LDKRGRGGRRPAGPPPPLHLTPSPGVNTSNPFPLLLENFEEKAFRIFNRQIAGVFEDVTSSLAISRTLSAS